MRKTMGNYCTECGDSHEDEWEELCPACLEFEQAMDYENEMSQQAQQDYEQWLQELTDGAKEHG